MLGLYKHLGFTPWDAFNLRRYVEPAIVNMQHLT
jgi:hypothetical protein